MTRYERFGWTMFAVSGIFFLILGIRDREWLTVAGAVAWVIGCISFLIGASR